MMQLNRGRPVVPDDPALTALWPSYRRREEKEEVSGEGAVEPPDAH